MLSDRPDVCLHTKLENNTRNIFRMRKFLGGCKFKEETTEEDAEPPFERAGSSFSAPNPQYLVLACRRPLIMVKIIFEELHTQSVILLKRQVRNILAGKRARRVNYEPSNILNLQIKAPSTSKLHREIYVSDRPANKGRPNALLPHRS